jgi:hypothetical protein
MQQYDLQPRLPQACIHSVSANWQDQADGAFAERQPQHDSSLEVFKFMVWAEGSLCETANEADRSGAQRYRQFIRK